MSTFGHWRNKVIETLERICTPDGVLRIGLRYIDEIRVPNVGDEPEDWDGYINSQLLAAAAAELRPAGMNATAWQGRIQYQTEASYALTVRYGPQTGYAVDPEGPTRRKSVHPPGPYFLLDSDAFWTSEHEIPCSRRAAFLNAVIECIKQRAISSRLRSLTSSRRSIRLNTDAPSTKDLT